MEEKTFPTQEAAGRLREIEKWLPEFGQNKFMRHFCSYVGGRLNDVVVPTGFLVAYLLVMEDARSGKDGFTTADMPRELTGQHPMVYSMCMHFQSAVARAAFGDEFGDLVDAQIRAMEQ